MRADRSATVCETGEKERKNFLEHCDRNKKNATPFYFI
jgi:hypothetical protein